MVSVSTVRELVVKFAEEEKKMLGCRMAMSSKGVMQRLEMSVDRQPAVAGAVGVTMLIEMLQLLLLLLLMMMIFIVSLCYINPIQCS